MGWVGDGWTWGAGVLSGFCLLGLSALFVCKRGVGYLRVGGVGQVCCLVFVCWVCLHCLCASVGGDTGGWVGCRVGGGCGCFVGGVFSHGTLSFFCL